MKSHVSKFLFVFSLLFIFGHTGADAQIDTDSVFRVNVPFAFSVRDKTFPAGEYVIQTPAASTHETGVLEMASASTKGKKRVILFSTTPLSMTEAPTESNIIFGKIGGKYFLSEIWPAESTNGGQVEEPHMMKALEKGGLTKERQVIRAELTHKKAR